MPNVIRINSQSVRKLSTDIMNETNKLLQMMDIAKAKVDGSVPIFDSTSAKEFRKAMEEFTVKTKIGASTSLTNLADYFEAVAQYYERTDNEISEIGKQYLSTDIFG